MGRKDLIKMPVKLYDPENKPVVVDDLVSWCKERGYSTSRFYDLFVGHGLMAYGYTIVPCKNLRCKSYTLVDPFGEQVEVENLTAWCKENGFDKSTFYKLVKGQRKSVNGYTLFSKPDSNLRHDGSEWIQS